MTNITQIIYQETQKLFNALGVSCVITAQDKGEEGVFVDVQIKEPQLFIGERGQTLAEIQHLLRIISKKKTGRRMPLYIDINNYRKNRDKYLRELAYATADEVVLLKQERELPIMPAAERRVVHEAVAQRNGVVSESVGEDPARRIIVRVKD